jgi:hypothetical protein
MCNDPTCAASNSTLTNTIQLSDSINCVLSVNAPSNDAVLSSTDQLTSVRVHLAAPYPIIYLINATSLVKPAATELLAQDLCAHCVTIAIVTESWYKPYMTDDLLSINNYVLYRKDRPSRKGGGVCFYISDSVVSDAYLNLELLAVCCYTDCGLFVIVGAYHPPKPLYSNAAFVDAVTADFEFLFMRFLMRISFLLVI